MKVIWSVKIIVDCWVHAWSSLGPPIVGTAFRCHYIVFGSRPKAYVHEILHNQRHKPLPDGESVQPLSLLFHEQRSDIKLQPSTGIAKKMNKSEILFWRVKTWKTTIFFSYMQLGLSYLRYELRWFPLKLLMCKTNNRPGHTLPNTRRYAVSFVRQMLGKNVIIYPQVYGYFWIRNFSFAPIRLPSTRIRRIRHTNPQLFFIQRRHGYMWKGLNYIKNISGIQTAHINLVCSFLLKGVQTSVEIALLTIHWQVIMNQNPLLTKSQI